MSTQPLYRLSVIFAKDASIAVILKRGPSKWYQLILWHIKTDTFEIGQWFKGNIQLCDLSPGGKYLLYNAMKYDRGFKVNAEGYDYQWLAVSRPPYFTALALWTNFQMSFHDVYFSDDRTLVFTVPDGSPPPKAHPKHVPQGLIIKTKAISEQPRFRGIYTGWELLQEPARFFDGATLHQFSIVLYKTNLAQTYRLIQRHGVTGEYCLFDMKQETEVLLPGITWADWDQTGRLIAGHGGQLITINPENVSETRLLIDLTAYKPEPLAPPSWATAWHNSKLRKGKLRKK